MDIDPYRVLTVCYKDLCTAMDTDPYTVLMTCY